MSQLTDKQEAFIRAYLGEARFNGRIAAEKAGYGGSDAVLYSIASENLSKPKIREEIDRRLDEMIPSDSELIAALAAIAMGDDADAKASDRRRALRDLLELRGRFVERVEHTGDVTYRVTIPGHTRE